MARGVVSLYGVKSELFVAMNNRGRLYGTVGVRNRVGFLSACQCNEDLHPQKSSACVLNR